MPRDLESNGWGAEARLAEATGTTYVGKGPYLFSDRDTFMASIVDRRVTVKIEGDFVVFLIGMRINKLWKPHKWLPAIRRCQAC